MTSFPQAEIKANQENIGILNATVYQIALINNLLPRGFKFEQADNIRKVEAESKSSKRKKKVIIRVY